MKTAMTREEQIKSNKEMGVQQERVVLLFLSDPVFSELFMGSSRKWKMIPQTLLCVSWYELDF